MDGQLALNDFIKVSFVKWIPRTCELLVQYTHDRRCRHLYYV